MDRTARLIEAADSVHRRIWASLPFGVRLAHFLERFAAVKGKPFGRAIYEIFSRLGVPGVPESKAGLIAQGESWGQNIWFHAMSKFHNPEMVADILQDTVVKFAHGSTLDVSHGIKQAQNYVLRAVITRGIDVIKSRKRKKEISDLQSHNDDNPRQMEHKVEDFNPSAADISMILRSYKPALDRIHPSAAEFVRLRLIDGYDLLRVIGDPAKGIPSMLSHPYTKSGTPLTPPKWKETYQPVIEEFLYEALSKEFDIAV